MVGGRIETSATCGSLVARAISPPHVSRCEGPAKHAPIFCPLFDKYNIDIALESDGHCMKRTVPIRDGKRILPESSTWVKEASESASENPMAIVGTLKMVERRVAPTTLCASTSLTTCVSGLFSWTHPLGTITQSRPENSERPNSPNVFPGLCAERTIPYLCC